MSDPVSAGIDFKLTEAIKKDSLKGLLSYCQDRTSRAQENLLSCRDGLDRLRELQIEARIYRNIANSIDYLIKNRTDTI